MRLTDPSPWRSQHNKAPKSTCRAVAIFTLATVWLSTLWAELFGIRCSDCCCQNWDPLGGAGACACYGRFGCVWFQAGERAARWGSCRQGAAYAADRGERHCNFDPISALPGVERAGSGVSPCFLSGPSIGAGRRRCQSYVARPEYAGWFAHDWPTDTAFGWTLGEGCWAGACA